jgi:hypothetical protein
MKYASLLLCLASCAHGEAALRAELATLPLARAAPSVSVTEEVVRASFGRALMVDLVQYASSSRPVALVVADAGEKVIPPSFSGKLALVTRPQLESLAERYATGVQYFRVYGEEDQAGLFVHVVVGMAFPPGTVSMCCEDRTYVYEKRDGLWAYRETWSGEF